MTERERCKELGGVWIRNRCVIRDVWRAIDKVLSCVEEEVDKVPLKEPVEPDRTYDIAHGCVAKLTKGLNVSSKTLKRILDGTNSTIDEARLEPNATVYDENDEEVGVITNYERPSDFKVKWVSTDVWRGYYDVVTSPDWALLHEDTILAGSEDAEELEDFHHLLRSYLRVKGIPFRTVFARTSNIFSTNYYFFVPANRKAEVEEYAKRLAEIYRDPTKFTMTALTGHDPPYSPEEMAFVETACELFRKRGKFTGIMGESKREEC